MLIKWKKSVTVETLDVDAKNVRCSYDLYNLAKEVWRICKDPAREKEQFFDTILKSIT